ncbi:MAG TPA: FecR family protein [Rhodanobacteraceae bacterium]|nr:FecR family protein [Rhodanobacteraceae bacterium]
MSNQDDPEVERERLLRQLFARAEPRPQPPASHTEEIRRAVLAEWDAVTGRRVWRKRAAFGAVAAAALWAAFVYVGGGPEPSVSTALVARVEQVQGVVTTASGARLGAGSGVVAGARLDSGEGQIALRLASGGSLRIAPRSRVVLVGGDEAELLAGVLYFDSEAQRASEFAVLTELGRVRDVGTQFLVRLDDERLDVGVREGLVNVTRGAISDTAAAGERLVATQASNGLRRDSIPTVGDDWEWAERLAPPFDINGRTLGEFLAWFEAQTGRTVVFADAAVERVKRAAVLSGSVDLPPMQKLSAVLAVNDLTYVLDGDRVVIEMR